MIYLSGAPVPSLPLRSDIGVMYSPAMGNRIDLSRRFALDNGCFTQGSAFDLVAWLSWLMRFHAHRDRCLFAVAPDVVGDAAATIERSRAVLPMIRELGYPAAFVAQDGLEDLPVPWDSFDALFVGGTTRWKLSEAAYALAVEAKRRGKWTHLGRCNSERRFRAAAAHGYDSADGTFLAFGPDRNLPRLLGWLDRASSQPALIGG